MHKRQFLRTAAALVAGTIDADSGSAGMVTRVASGTYDRGLADMAALMEFHANNPTRPTNQWPS